MATSSCLPLPAELRTRIYELCSPVHGYAEDFSGLRCVSKQTRAEYETEAVKTVDRYLNRIRKAWPYPQEVRIDSPRNFSELVHIAVQLPTSLYCPPHGNDWGQSDMQKLRPRDGSKVEMMEACLAALFSLYLSSLTITYYDNCNGLVRFNLNILLPHGVLWGLTNVLVGKPLFRPGEDQDQTGVSEPRSRSGFCTSGTLHTRRVVYKWYRNEQTAEYVRAVESKHIKFFLTAIAPGPMTPVANWGRGDDYVYFDMKTSVES
jgi:hypothetical protein